MGRAKLHVVPNTQVAPEAEGPVSKPGPVKQSPASKPVKKSAPKKPSLSRVADFMQKDVASCRPYEPLNTVGRLMWDRDVGVVVIVDEQLRPVSMVTDRDVAMAAYTQGATLANIGVRSCMSQRLVACSEDATATDALTLMENHRVRRLPVVDAAGKLVGIIGLGDLTKNVATKTRKTGLKVNDVSDALAKILE